MKLKRSFVKNTVLSAALVGLLAACAVPAALEPQRTAAVPMPVNAAGTTVVTGVVPGYEGSAGTIGSSFDVRNVEVNYASGTISDSGAFTLELQVPPRNALLAVADAWPAGLDIISSNPQARLAFIYYYAVYEGRERPEGWIFMDSVEDPEDDPQAGDIYAAYVYANEPTRIRINATASGFRYVSDLNLARGWNRVVTEVVSVAPGIITQRETVDYSSAVPWQYLENE